MAEVNTSLDARLETLVEATGARIRVIEAALHNLGSMVDSPMADDLRGKKDLLVGAIVKLDAGNLYELDAKEARAVEGALRSAVGHPEFNGDAALLRETTEWFTTEIGPRADVTRDRPELSALDSAPAAQEPDWPGAGIER